MGWGEGGTREFRVAFVVERSMKRKVLDFKTDDDRIYTLRTKTKFQTLSFNNAHAPTEEKHETELSENGRSTWNVSL